MKIWATIILVLSAFVPGREINAQIQFERLKSFGFTDQIGTAPNGNLIQASDEFLYGTSSGDGGVVFRMRPDGTGYQVLHSFVQIIGDGNTPYSGVIEGKDGALYGTTIKGGATDSGTVYRINKDGTAYKTLHHFRGDPTEGQYPFVELLEGSDGLLYGTARNGGIGFSGTVFRIHKDGTDFTLLHAFLGWEAQESGNPGRLIEGTDGCLYGISFAGGAHGNGGTVFKLNRDGTGYQVLRSFGWMGEAGTPNGSLLEGPDRKLYGVTASGGTNNGWPGRGAIFTLNKDGSDYQILHSFTTEEGRVPHGPLITGDDGALYGVTAQGGSEDAGTLFRITATGSGFATLYQFSRATGGTYGPWNGLLRGKEGAFYGASSGSGLGTLFKVNQDGTGFKLLRSFLGVAGGDGTRPQGDLFEGKDEILYGTTYDGGLNNAGTVFAVNRDGSGYRVIISFLGFPFRESQSPNGGLVDGHGDALYGTARSGGTYGYGTIFRTGKDGRGYSILHHFPRNATDGGVPLCGLVAAQDGRLYGTTSEGVNCGTVFGLNCDGSGYALLHVFDQSGSDGIWPYARVIEGTDGLLYGTTYGGGTYGISVGGTVFRLSKDGSGFAVLHNLNGAGGEGCRPQGPVLEASDGMLYGTTSAGDGRSYAGTVFKVGKDGTAFEVLHEFGKDKGDGSSPTSGLVEGWGMALYGTTAAGGINGRGVVFKLNTNGSNYRILHQFAANEDRYISPGPLSFSKDHAFYLTTRFGGDLNYGSLLRLTPPQLDKIIITPAGSNQLLFTGSGGQTYQILSSTELNRWSILQTFIMPETGTYLYLLSSRTQTENCFYRATWVP